MKKIIKIAMAIVLTISTVLGSSLNGNIPAGASTAFEVWSAPSTVKIEKFDTEYAKKGASSLYFYSAINEYESCQLILTAGKDIESYDLKSATLTDDEGNEIASSNFEIYNALYAECLIEVTGSGTYPAGYYPDALIPMAYAKKANENKAEKNSNACIWVTVFVPKGTVAGKYTGNFRLTVDGQNFNIPVTVDVANFEITDTVNTKSWFSGRYLRVAAGELDSSVDMMEAYYDFALSYRCNIMQLPTETASSEDYIEQLEKYWNNPAFTQYNLSTWAGNVPYNDFDGFRQLILDIAAASSQKYNYLSKAFLYIFDEPKITDYYAIVRFTTIAEQANAMLQACVQEIENDTTGKFDTFKSIVIPDELGTYGEGNTWKSIILNIRRMFTGGNITDIIFKAATQGDVYALKFLSQFNVWSPNMRIFGDSFIGELEKLANEMGAELWWYHAFEPGVTYQIADDLLCARTEAWMRIKYNVASLGYWSFGMYTTEDGGLLTSNESVDVYTDAYQSNTYHAGNCNLVYPGAKYNHYGPLPSIRLMAIRDGMEDYEVIYAMQKKLDDLITKNGYDTTSTGTLESLISRIYYGNIWLYADGEGGLDFSELRKELFESYYDLFEDPEFVLGDVLITGNQVKASFYVKDGVKVYIDDVLQVPISDNKYQYVTSTDGSLLKVKCVVGNNEYYYERFLTYETKIIHSFDDISEVPSSFALNGGEGSAFAINTDSNYISGDSGKSLNIKLYSKWTGDFFDDSTFRPRITLYVDGFENVIDFTTITSLNFNVYNAGETQETVTVYLYSGTRFVKASSVLLEANKLNEVSISISTLSFDKLDSVDRVILEFENGGTQDEPKLYDIYLDNVYAKYPLGE